MTATTTFAGQSLAVVPDRTRLTPFRDPVPMSPVIQPLAGDGRPDALRVQIGCCSSTTTEPPART
jgi:hypothetical protein